VTWLCFIALFFMPQTPVQEPPEEDVNPQTVREYTFNPLQAAKEIKVANYYFKKGSYRAAARRFEEALKWDPNSAEAYLRLGDTRTKMGDAAAARTAYEKYLELEPSSKEASVIRKKLGKDAVKPPNAGSGEPSSRGGSR
jgi:Tfp pilus assembly protein PilF